MNDFENMMLSESGQSQNVTYCMIPFRGNVQNRQIYGDRELTSDCFGLGRADELGTVK